MLIKLTYYSFRFVSLVIKSSNWMCRYYALYTAFKLSVSLYEVALSFAGASFPLEQSQLITSLALC